ncbi:HEAT repeat domain-containing protein [Microbacterium saperdae]
MLPLPTQRLHPRDAARLAEEHFGRDLTLAWCEDLLSGEAVAGDTRYPDIVWIRGALGWPPYWSRVWGARALLHIGPPARPDLVLRATGDDAWRVREMALKVIAAHQLPDPDGVVDALTDDPVERVRRQAWRALGRPREMSDR